MRPEELDELEALIARDGIYCNCGSSWEVAAPKLIAALRDAWLERDVAQTEFRLAWKQIEHWKVYCKDQETKARTAERQECIAIADDVMRAVHSGAEVAEEIRDRIRARGGAR